jgi:hypothetical protein
MRVNELLCECPKFILETEQAGLLSPQFLTEAELLESIFSKLRDSFKRTSEYLANISQAISTAKQLKSRDGKKIEPTAAVVLAAKEMRERCRHLYETASDKMKAAVDKILTAAGVSLLSAMSISRQYFKEYVVLSAVFNLLSSTAAGSAKAALDFTIDQAVGTIIAVVTGIPNIDNVKDAAGVAKKSVAALNTIASTINSLKDAS